MATLTGPTLPTACFKALSSLDLTSMKEDIVAPTFEALKWHFPSLPLYFKANKFESMNYGGFCGNEKIFTGYDASVSIPVLFIIYSNAESIKPPLHPFKSTIIRTLIWIDICFFKYNLYFISKAVRTIDQILFWEVN